MFYLIIGLIICFFTMKYYDWPTKTDKNISDGTPEMFPALMWACFIVLFWPIVIAVWIAGVIYQFLTKDGG